MLALPITFAESAVNERLNNTKILYVTGDKNQTFDNSTYANLGDIVDGTWVTQTTKFQVGDKATENRLESGTIEFSHINAYKYANFSFCLWTNISVPVSSSEQIINFKTSGQDAGWLLQSEATGTKIQFDYIFSNSGNQPRITLNKDWSAYAGTFTQICVVVNDTDSVNRVSWGFMYFNGSEVATNQITLGEARTDPFPNHKITLGEFAGFNGATGVYDELIIWNTSLTRDEINQTYMLGVNRTTLKNKDLPSSIDTNSPSINISLNDTALIQGEKINVTGNWSDNIGGDVGQVIVNQTGENVFYNFTLSGTSGYFGENITIAVGATSVINFTVRINDTSNNKNQSSLILTVADTTPPIIVNFSLQHQPIMNKSNTNIFQIHCKDSESALSKINFTLSFNNTDNSTKSINVLTGGTTSEVSSFSISGNSSSSSSSSSGQKSYIWNYTLFSQAETAKEGIWNITNVGCIDISNNYARNDSENKLVGYDFLMDTPPTINSRSPTNDSNFTSASDTTGNLVITEDNPSFMLLFHNITNGVWKLNQTINYSGDGTTQNLFNLTGMVDKGSYVYATSINTSFGTWSNSSNITFGVIVASGNGGDSSSLAGGGGGGGIFIIEPSKKKCRTYLNPNKLSFYVPIERQVFSIKQPEFIKKTSIINNDTSTFSPLIKIDNTNLIKLEGGIRTLLKPQEKEDLIFIVNDTKIREILKSVNGSKNTILTEIKIGSSECIDIILPISIESEILINNSLSNIEDFFTEPIKEVDIGLKNVLKINILGLTLFAIFLSLLIIFIPTKMQNISKTSKTLLFFIFTFVFTSILRIFIGIL